MSNISYGFKMEWRDFNGTLNGLEVGPMRDQEMAKLHAISIASTMGWKPPRWWQWWRWDEPVRSNA